MRKKIKIAVVGESKAAIGMLDQLAEVIKNNAKPTQEESKSLSFYSMAARMMPAIRMLTLSHQDDTQLQFSFSANPFDKEYSYQGQFQGAQQILVAVDNVDEFNGEAQKLAYCKKDSRLGQKFPRIAFVSKNVEVIKLAAREGWIAIEAPVYKHPSKLQSGEMHSGDFIVQAAAGFTGAQLKVETAILAKQFEAFCKQSTPAVGNESKSKKAFQGALVSQVGIVAAPKIAKKENNGGVVAAGAQSGKDQQDSNASHTP